MEKIPRPSPVEWLCLILGLFLTIHYGWITDDAFVYLRYVDNVLFLGDGLVYNRGEYVEGFSSPLWALLLTAFRATGLNYWTIIRLVGVMSFVLFWILLVILNRRLSPKGGPFLNLPLFYLSLNYGVLCHFTSGLETPLVQLMAPIYALLILNPSAAILQLLVALSPLVRHEMTIPFAVCFGWVWWKRKSFPLRMLLAFVLFMGTWLAFRIYYYADLFPATFYLKDVVDFRQGLNYLKDTAIPYRLLGYLAASFLLAGLARLKSGSGSDLRLVERGVMVLAALPVVVYVTKIGGAPRHYIYLAFPFCLIVMSTAGAVEHAFHAFSLHRYRKIAYTIACVFGAWAVSLYPRQLSEHPFFFEETHRPRRKINDASLHRHHEDLSLPRWGKGNEIEIKDQYQAYRKRRPKRRYRGITVNAWCADIYRDFDRWGIQNLGLTDAILARADVPVNRPSHKNGLIPLANDIAAIVRTSGLRPSRGMYRSAVRSGNAPEWVARNLDSIEVIERKIYNRHDLWENLELAFTFPPKIQP
jgi:hypothetical protein